MILTLAGRDLKPSSVFAMHTALSLPVHRSDAERSLKPCVLLADVCSLGSACGRLVLESERRCHPTHRLRFVSAVAATKPEVTSKVAKAVQRQRVTQSAVRQPSHHEDASEHEETSNSGSFVW